jgi:hypothetical protein
MNNQEDSQKHKHQQPIKDINEHFMTHNKPIRPLHILNNTQHRPNKHKDTGQVQRPHMFSPGKLICNSPRGGISSDAQLEDHSADEEESEEKDLNDEAADDDVLAGA